MLEHFSETQLTVMGMGVVALLVGLGFLLMKWEAHRATNMWEKRNKKRNDLH